LCHFGVQHKSGQCFEGDPVMQCFEALFGLQRPQATTVPLESYSMGKIDVYDPDNGTSFTYIIPDSEKAKVDAACKLEANFARVVEDITNPGPKNIDGKSLSQIDLQRVDPEHVKTVEHLVSAVCSRLRGNKISIPPADKAKVWEKAAKFLGARIQGSKTDCPGREPDMSAASATAMKTVLGHIEAASKLMWNREVVVKDICNPEAIGVKGGELSQEELQRLDPVHRAEVDAMVREVCDRLLGGGSPIYTSLTSLCDPDFKGKALVWAHAASFLASRIQGPGDECDFPHEQRNADMSSAAATALRTTLARMEAAHRLATNFERVVQDICNPGPSNIDGKELTQLNLKRVKKSDKLLVEEMVKAVCSLLLGQPVSIGTEDSLPDAAASARTPRTGPSTSQDALVWIQAATFFSGRIQKSDDEMPGRAADMSIHAALAMQKALAQIEAAAKLISNRETVVKDICNPGPKPVKAGGELTQTDLKRLQPTHLSSVDAMMREVCGRLLGKSAVEPDPSEAQVWADAAKYFHLRTQAASKEMPGRNRDMSTAAATAMRTVLAQFLIPEVQQAGSAMGKSQKTLKIV